MKKIDPPWTATVLLLAFSFRTLMSWKPRKLWMLLLSRPFSSVSLTRLARCTSLVSVILVFSWTILVFRVFLDNRSANSLVATQLLFGDYRAWQPCCALPVGTPSRWGIQNKQYAANRKFIFIYYNGLIGWEFFKTFKVCVVRENWRYLRCGATKFPLPNR